MANTFKITDVVDEKAITDLRELNKHLLETKDNFVGLTTEIGKVIKSPVNSFDELTKKADGYEDTMRKLAESQKQIIAIQSQYNKLLDDVNKKVKEAVAAEKKKKEETQKSKITVQEAIELSKTQAKSIKEAREQNAKLRRVVQELNVEDEEQRKIILQLNSAINVNNSLIKRNSDQLTQNKMTVGDYKEQVKAAIIELKNSGMNMHSVGIVAKGFANNLKNDFSAAWEQVSSGGKVFAGVLKLVRTALLATGIGTIITALASLAAMVTRTQKGVEAFSKSWAAVTAAFDVVLDRAAILGESIVKIFKGDFRGAAETARKAVKGIGEEIKNEIILASQLKDVLNQLDKQEIMLNMSRAASRSEIAKLKKDAEDTTKSLKERMKAAQEAYEMERRDLQQQMDISEKRLANTLGFTDMNKEVRKLLNQIKSGDVTADEVISKLGLASSTVEDLKEFSEEFINLQNLAEQSYTRQTELQNKLNQLRKDAVKKAIGNEESAAILTSKNAMDIELNNLTELYTKGELKKEEYENKKSDITERYSIEQAEINIEYLKKQLENTFLSGEEKLEIQRQIGEKEIELSGKIRDKAIKVLEDARNQTKKTLNNIANDFVMQSITAEKAMSDELDALADQYAKGLISKEQYEKKKAEIAEKYALKQAQDSIAHLKKQMEVSGLPEEEQLKLKQELGKKEIELAEKIRDAKIKKTEEANEKIKQSTEDIISFVNDSLGGIGDLAAAFSERKIQAIEEEEEANEEAYNKEIERIEQLADKGAISQEEAEARKRAAEQQTAAKEEELARKKAEIQTRQAKLDKSISISQAIINTALGIMTTIKNLGMPAAIPFIAMQSALGAIQLATIIAQPIPKYAKGTKDHKGGLAIVGDGGKQEAVITEHGVWATPSTPTLVDLPKGAIVLPDLNAVKSMNGAKSDLLLLMEKSNKNKGDGVVVNVSNDYTKLERRMDANSSELKQIKKILKQQGMYNEKMFISHRI